MSKFLRSTRNASKLLNSLIMPASTLYGALGSSNAARVRLTLAEGGFTDFELVLLDLRKREQKVRLMESISLCLTSSSAVILTPTNSPKNTRNDIHGVKSPRSLPPMALLCMRVVQSANISQRSTPSLFFRPAQTLKQQLHSTKHSP